jgi:hypothetical protein
VAQMPMYKGRKPVARLKISCYNPATILLPCSDSVCRRNYQEIEQMPSIDDGDALRGGNKLLVMGC